MSTAKESRCDCSRESFQGFRWSEKCIIVWGRDGNGVFPSFCCDAEDIEAYWLPQPVLFCAQVRVMQREERCVCGLLLGRSLAPRTPLMAAIAETAQARSIWPSPTSIGDTWAGYRATRNIQVRARTKCVSDDLLSTQENNGKDAGNGGRASFLDSGRASSAGWSACAHEPN